MCKYLCKILWCTCDAQSVQFKLCIVYLLYMEKLWNLFLFKCTDNCYSNAHITFIQVHNVCNLQMYSVHNFIWTRCEALIPLCFKKFSFYSLNISKFNFNITHNNLIHKIAYIFHKKILVQFWTCLVHFWIWNDVHG